MTRLFLKIFIIFILSLPVQSCRKTVVINSKQAVLFQVEYVNGAENRRHYGFFVDNQGKILAYDNPADWAFPDKQLMINSLQLNSDLSKCRDTGLKVPEEELLNHARVIKNISASKVTAMKRSSPGSGSMKYICYQFNEGTGIYKGSLIKMEGDSTCENLNFYSKRVALWLRGIFEKIDKN